MFPEINDTNKTEQKIKLMKVDLFIRKYFANEGNN